MAKLRKMLGDVNSQVCRDIMALIATQNKRTIERWAVEYAAEKCLPVFEKHMPDVDVLRTAVEKCREYAEGSIKLKDLKPFVAEARKYASAVKGDVEQAAARAVATACASVQTPTNAFGFTMYAAAARAYDALGLEDDIADYEEFAQREMQSVLESFGAVCVENEPDPVKIDWNC